MATEIILEGRLDQNAASKLYNDLSNAQTEPIKIDASSVSLLGGQCLQVLLSAANQWRANNIEFVIQNPSTAFQENMDTLGVCVSGDLLSVAEAN
ncbi:MAG: STAS domain-containing protein [Pseudomonadota bacterium]